MDDLGVPLLQAGHLQIVLTVTISKQSHLRLFESDMTNLKFDLLFAQTS